MITLTPNSFGARRKLEEYNKCHDPATGRFCSTPDLATHLSRDAVLEPKGVEGYYDKSGRRKETEPRWYNTTSPTGKWVQLKGRPLTQWERDNTVLYHVTTHLDGILKDGEITAFESGAGLGGGNHPAVSFTTNRKDALNILDVLTKAVQVVRDADAGGTEQEIGDRVLATIKAWSSRELAQLAKTTYPPKFPDDGPLDGVPYKVLDPLRNGMQEVETTLRLHLSIARKEGYDVGSAALDAFKHYLNVRDTAGLGKNPVLFTRPDSLRKAKTVGMIVVPGRSLPKDVMVNIGADKFQHEVEVHGDVPISKAYYLTRKRL